MAVFSRIAGTGAYLPEKVLTNAELEKMVDTSDQWIRERTGIRERRIAGDDESVCDLALHAARRALEMADVAAGDLDLIVVATTTPDKVFPSTACQLQGRLGVGGCPAFDLQAVCTGFIYALDLADRFVRAGDADNALVVGAEVLSRIVDWNDRSTCVLFADGAGAAVLQASDEPGIYSTHLHADGRQEELLHAPGGPGAATSGNVDGLIQMKGNEVFKVAVNTLGSIVDEALGANGFEKSDVDWLVPHQANYRIIAATAKKLKLPIERVVVTVDRHGNTSAASIPLALDEAVRDGRIRRGDRLMLEAFGGGFTWGATLARF